MEQLYWNTCRWLLQLLVLLQTLISASSGPLGTGCIWRSSISSSLPEDQGITPRPECVEGQLWWYYPKGTLSVTFEPESKEYEFELCFLKNKEETSGDDPETSGEEVFHIQGRKRVPLDQTSQDIICVQSVRGQVLLDFTSPSKRQRLKIIEYFRRDPT